MAQLDVSKTLKKFHGQKGKKPVCDDDLSMAKLFISYSPIGKGFHIIEANHKQ